MVGPQITLPRPVFQYTLDQIAMCLAISETTLKIQTIHFDRLTAGRPPRDKLTAHNIADLGESPNWRVSETELLRWLKVKGYRTAFNRLY